MILKTTMQFYQMRKQRNTFESKYHAANEELLKLYRKRSDILEEIENYKQAALEWKAKYKEEKIKRADLEIKLKKHEKPTTVMNNKKNKKKEGK